MVAQSGPYCGPMPDNAVPYMTIAKELAAGRVIPFLGAGASLGDRPAPAKPPDPPVWKKGSSRFLPTTAELAGHIAEMAGLPADIDPDLAAIAEYHAVEAADREALHTELHEIFDDDYELAPLHRLLARVERPLLIVTTNYDDLVERALGDRPFDLVVHRTSEGVLWRPHRDRPREVPVQDLEVDPDTTTIVYKIHGTAFRGDSRQDQYVITEDDYLEFLGRMTNVETIVPPPINEAFQRRRFLFLGYGLHDWNIRVILNRLQRHLRSKEHTDRRSWAIDHAPAELDQALWSHRGVKVYKVELGVFVERVLAMWPLS
jgi:hypothetical protein